MLLDFAFLNWQAGGGDARTPTPSPVWQEAAQTRTTATLILKKIKGLRSRFLNLSVVTSIGEILREAPALFTPGQRPPRAPPREFTLGPPRLASCRSPAGPPGGQVLPAPRPQGARGSQGAQRDSAESAVPSLGLASGRGSPGPRKE